MTYDDLKKLAEEANSQHDGTLFGESHRVSILGLETAILDNKIDRALLSISDKSKSGNYDLDEVTFFQEKIKYCLDEIDSYINDTVSKVTVYRENKVNKFFKDVWNYLVQLFRKIKAIVVGWFKKKKGTSAFKKGQTVNPEPQTEKAKRKETADVAREYVSEIDDKLEDIDRFFSDKSPEELREEKSDVIRALNEVSEEQKRSGEVTYIKNIYDKVYRADADIDMRRAALGEVMSTYNLKQLSSMLVKHVKASPLLKSKLAKYVRVLKVAKNSGDIVAVRTILGNLMLAVASESFFSDETKQNFFLVEVDRIFAVVDKANVNINAHGAIDSAVFTILDNAEMGSGTFDYSNMFLQAASNLLDVYGYSKNPDYLKPLRVPLPMVKGLNSTLPDLKTLEKWRNIKTDLMSTNMNGWYKGQLGTITSIADGLTKFNNAVDKNSVRIIADKLSDDANKTDLGAEAIWSVIIQMFLGEDTLETLTPSALESMDKSRFATIKDITKSGFNLDLYNKCMNYSEMLDVIRVSDKVLYEKMPSDMTTILKNTSKGMDVSVLDKTLEKMTTMFQVKLANEDDLGQDLAKGIKSSITVRLNMMNQLMKATTNYLKLSEQKMQAYREMMTSLLEQYVADIGLHQYGVLTVIDNIISDKYLTDMAVSEICGS